ncbi:TPA: DUF1433 domain-containing protein [Staphylococcus aureus]|uniref:Uncharacterized protein n=4 Tax=Staphylococcus aureus TaxID=1280 RepID=A0A6N3YUX4_STAAU|nr:DUF1433 domain-containing protein [Staphylococcus aureus]HDH6211208.1 DUF1433 domain-containing protein [Staphylococcus aureus LTCF-12-55]HDH6224835.1 DUF1433 domain-containing protein [Staphylococcus aureus LTCF-12-46]HDH6263452.1 DUF1433 domain-containing protein [Staphylococcus aureus LTCF-7-30]HDH6420196.1 DUF1433 domain-containing protein [Staphylococcus aureus MRSA-Lux-33]HDH6425080.1 DUF1433 domain-containing protein [Staphylococcus aureus MRSA-Lux-34]HDH6425433.1 DUF1433 domain-con
MKKRYVFVVVVAILIGLIVIAYAHNKQIKAHYIKTQEKRIDLYFKHNLNNYKNMKVTDFHKTPMGGYFIVGYINDDKKYKFQASIDSGSNNQYQKDIGYHEDKLGKLFKEKDPKYKLSVDEIIEKEHLDKSEYEADPPLFFFSGRLE